MKSASFQMRYLHISCPSSPRNELLPHQSSPDDGGTCSHWWFVSLHLNTISYLTIQICFIPGKHITWEAAWKNFRALVETTLSLLQLQQQEDGGNRNKSLKKLSLIYTDGINHSMAHTNQLISKALELGVPDLYLRIMPLIIGGKGYHLYKCLPSTAFTSKTLVKLTLETALRIGDVPTGKVCLPVLKSLFIYTSSWFPDEFISDFVVRGCPVLEELYMHHNYIEGSYSHTSGPYDFCHPTIKRITMHRQNVKGIRSLEFYTPNLVYLDCSDRLVWYNYISANCLDTLLEARLDLLSQQHPSPFETQTHPKLISWICNVQILHLSSNTVEVFVSLLSLSLSFSIHHHFVCVCVCVCVLQFMLLGFDHWGGNGGFPLFGNLVKLSFECKTKRGSKVLWSLIKNSPKLETLILKVWDIYTYEYDPSGQLL